MQVPEPSPNEIKKPPRTTDNECLGALRHPAVPEKPLVITRRSEHISVTVIVTPSARPEIDQVVFRGFNSSGTPVVAFQTAGRIHSRMHAPILQVLEEGGSLKEVADVLKQRSPMTALSALRAPHTQHTPSDIETIAHNLYTLLSNYSAIEWERVPLQAVDPSTMCSSGLVPVLPTLQQFISRPSIVEEQFSAKHVTSDDAINLHVTLHPDGEYLLAIAHITSLHNDDTTSQCWKILSSSEPFSKYAQIKQDLLNQAHALWDSLHSTGLEGATDLIEEPQRNVIAMPTSLEGRRQLDERLAQGLSDIVPSPYIASARELTSGASVELVFGQQYATISIRPNSQDREYYSSLVFLCSPTITQLTADHIRRIQTIYDALCSESSETRGKGLSKCAEIARLFNPAARSDILGVKMILAQPRIRDLFCTTDVESLLSIRGISLTTAASDGIETLRTLLDGGRPLTAYLSSTRGFPTRPELFHTMECDLMNDGDLRVRLTNSLGNCYVNVIPLTGHIDFPSHEGIVVSLCELFALQPTQSWVPLLQEVERLNGEDARNATLWPWEPSRAGLPPTSDAEGVRMLERAAQIYSQFATGYPTALPQGTICYMGAGAIELSVTGHPPNPDVRSALTLSLSLEYGYLREFAIYISQRTHENLGATDHMLARFHATDLRLDSDAAHTLLDMCADALHAVAHADDLGWAKTGEHSILGSLCALASKSMTRLTSSTS